MDYLTVEEARTAPGLRLVLTARFTKCLKTGMHLLGIALPERM